MVRSRKNVLLDTAVFTEAIVAIVELASVYISPTLAFKWTY
jgi:hypothetical protein